MKASAQYSSQLVIHSSNYPNAFLNNQVLSPVLKTLNDIHSFREFGRLFQSVGNSKTARSEANEQTSRNVIVESRIRAEVVSRRTLDRMQHLGEVDWSLVESALENEHANLELDSLLHGKPVKSVSYIGRDRVILEFAKHEMGSGAKNGLQST